MIKLAKLTDYAFVVMSYFYLAGKNDILTAKFVSERSLIPLPTVSKILKVLSKKGFLEAKRGVNGGYQISASGKLASIAEIIEAFEGPIALTDCSVPGVKIGSSKRCLAKERCLNVKHWVWITKSIVKVLSSIPLAKMYTNIAEDDSEWCRGD